MSEKFITDVKSIVILKERMEELKDMPLPDVTELWKYRIGKKKLNKNEFLENQ